MAGFSRTGLGLVAVGASATVVAALMAVPASAVTAPATMGVAAAGVVAGKAPSTKVKVTLDLKSVNDSVARFVGDVSGGPGGGTVILQRKTAAGNWRKVMSSDHTANGFSVSYAAQPGKYRAMVPLRTWYNHTRWYQQDHGRRWTGPAKAYSDVQTVADSGPADTSIKWVVGMGDSYASGEGATYAGYGPWNTTGTQKGFWWIEAFGSSLRETYPGDVEQPIEQPGLVGKKVDYRPSLTGDLCHRSASAMMYWSNPDYAAVNLACSGATQRTTGGKPGIDSDGQAAELQKFASDVVRNGDSIKVVSFSIGGNDVGFADIIEDCLTRFLNPFAKVCGRADTDSKLQRAYADGKGLYGVRNAVVNATMQIASALEDGGIDPSSVLLDLQLPPMGLPGATQMKLPDGTIRQEVGGCGFDNRDLDFVTGPFGDLLQQRFYQGAREAQNSLEAEYLGRAPKMVVTDATNAFDRHRLCENSVEWPKMEATPSYRPTGKNTLTPDWTGELGGAHGTWMTPIIVCANEGFACFANGGSLVHDYPRMMQALDCTGVDWGWPSWTARCHNDQPYTEAKQLPMHPNYWGQRALASCHEQIATNPANIGKIVECTPGVGLDAVGRPNMETAPVGPIKDSNRFLIETGNNPTKCMAIQDGPRSGVPSPVVLWPCDDSAQNQQTVGTKDGQIRIMGRCLDAKGGIGRDHRLVAYDCHGGANQRIEYTGPGDKGDAGRLKIGNYCIAVSENKPYDGAPLLLWDCKEEAGQHWRFEQIDPNRLRPV